MFHHTSGFSYGLTLNDLVNTSFQNILSFSMKKLLKTDGSILTFSRTKYTTFFVFNCKYVSLILRFLSFFLRKRFRKRLRLKNY